MKTRLGFVFVCIFCCNIVQANTVDSLLNRFSATNNHEEKILILCEISTLYSQTDFTLSRNFALRAHELSFQHNFESGMARSAMALGYAYDYHAQYDSAVFYYLESLQVYEMMHDTLGQSSALNNLGVCYFFSDQLDDALVYYKKSLRLEILTKNANGVADSYNNIAVVFRHTDRIDSAEYYFLEARKIYTQLGNLYGVAGTYLNTGLIAENRNNLSEAIRETQIATSYFIQSENWSDAGNSYNAVSDLFLKNKALDSARFYAEKGYELNKSRGFNQFLVNSLSTLIALDTLQGDYKSATRHLKEQAQVQDYLYQHFKDEQIENSRNLFELGSKEKEIFSLQTDNTQKDETITRKSQQVTQLILLIAAFGVLLLIIAFVVMKLRKLNKKLAENNMLVQQNLEEKEWLLKEIHHRVKNNLQIVSSLLNLQTRYISDDTAVSAIRDSQERVQAISILHQEIYRNEVLHKIQTADYFLRLMSGIQQTFDPEKRIPVYTQIHEKMLDVDQLLPLGLMLNEMLTNAYKYGTNSANPEIKITFKCTETDFELTLSDKGTGVKNLSALETGNTLGMKLVQIFAKKMKAQVSFKNEKGFQIAVSGKLKSN
jgi:two-component system, sensor histidine kinase PdtaS